MKTGLRTSKERKAEEVEEVLDGGQVFYCTQCNTRLIVIDAPSVNDIFCSSRCYDKWKFRLA